MHEFIGAFSQNGLNLGAGIVHDHEVAVDHAEVLVIFEVVAVSADPVANDRQEPPHESQYSFGTLFNLKGQRCCVGLHVYHSQEEVRPCEHGMIEVLRESPLPPVVHEALEEQSLGHPERVHVVLEEQSEVLFEADVGRPPLYFLPNRFYVLTHVLPLVTVSCHPDPFASGYLAWSFTQTNEC